MLSSSWASSIQFELFIANSGDPIPPAALEKIFEPFERGTLRSSLQGLGLGLYISCEIARAHGGTLEVSSTAAETRFTFRMPLAG
jgi:signal transduction histidine kinase